MVVDIKRAKYPRNKAWPFEELDLLVIGGGIAGIAITRAAAQKGKRVLLLEQASVLAPLQSVRHHNWLHRGTRYAVNEPEIATTLLRSSEGILRDAAGIVESTPVYYLATERATAARYSAAWKGLDIPFTPVDLRELQRQEPLLAGAPILEAFLTQDKVFSPHRLLARLAFQAQETGNATLMTDSEVTSLMASQGRVTGALVRDRETGDEWAAEAPLTINATGARGAQLLETAGVPLTALNFRLFKAHLVVTNRLTQSMMVCLDDRFQVVVPHSDPNCSVIDAASDHETDSSKDLDCEPKVVQSIQQAVQRLLPGAQFREIKPYCCVKAEYSASDTWGFRGKKPGIAVIRHLPGLLSVWPGKFSLYPFLVEEVMKWLP